MDRSLGWTRYFIQQIEVDELDTMTPVRVMAEHRNGLIVRSGDRESTVALGSNRFRLPPEEQPIVGDWVLVNESWDKVERLLERQSCLKRVDSWKEEVQLIAANIDVLFVVTSCNEEFNASRLERYLALAAEAEVMPVVVLTKADLATEPDQ